MSRSTKWLGGLLVLSVALNIFLGAFLFGRHLFDHDRPHRGDRYSMRLEMRALADALPESARDALRESMRQRREEVRPIIVEIHAAREDIIRELAADPLDEAALDTAFDRLAEALVALQVPLQDTIVAAATHMTPEQRQRMSDALARAHAHHMNRRKDGE